MKKSILLSFILLCIGFVLNAQVTTSSMSGKVVSLAEPIIGASILVVHEPSGTQYGAITNVDGRYNLQGMRVGGPYRVEISYIGYQKSVVKNVILQLGEVYTLNADLKESTENLDEVVVTAFKSVAKAGVATNISASQINSLPTINRSITDFTKLSPFAGGGNSFAGRDGRYNNITVDGASLNNSFGLGSANMPGGDAQPISLDAIEEISVNVSPYDVKYSNFTGASINAVTKSGNNTYKGSAYSFIRPQSFTGDKADGIIVPNAKTRDAYTYGLTLSGPIIKDKLFFFVNGELEKQTYPGINWRASKDGKSDSEQNIARTSEADMQKISDHLISKYGYDPGSYTDFGRFESNNWKIMTRVDWNINKNHKFTVRLNAVESKNDAAVNSNSAPNPRSDARFSINSMAFANSNYKFRNVVTSITGELNSTLTSNVSNKLLATYTHILDTRESKGSPFPFVDIYKQEGTKDPNQYMSFGTELFTPNNKVENNVLSFVDNVNISLDDHYITAGASFEKQYFFNSYLRYPLGYYRYASMDDFMNNAKPMAYGLTYGYNGNDAPGSELTFGMAGVYGQDEWSLSDVFKLTYGVRFDLPIYMNTLDSNPAIEALSFDNGRNIDVSKWPSAKMLFSPRVGFKWDVKNDRSIIINGGTGLFTGMLPFVWFTNQSTNSGVLQNTVEIPGNQLPDNFEFYPNYKDAIANHPDLFPTTPADKAPGQICFVDPDFKMPQVWRSSIGADIQLPSNFMLSLNALYTRDVNNVVQKNVNEKEAIDRFDGPDNRYFYPTKDNRLNKSISNAMMLTNGKEKGYQYSLNTVLTKKFEYGFYGMVSYTYSKAKDLTANPGSAANSAWSSNTSVNSLNDPGLSYSSFATPHRIVASISYEIEYLENMKTSFALFYSGYNTGRISYTASNDLNGDGNSSDLLYIPATKNDLLFVDMKDKAGKVIYTKESQADDFWNFVESDSYLKGRKGKYVERFGDLKPWINRFDFKVAQDFFVKTKSGRHGFQVSLDILNVGNLLNSAWGIYKKTGLSNYDDIKLLTYSGVSNENRPTYQINAQSSEDFAKKSAWLPDLSTSSTWGMMLGIKANF